MVLTTTPGMAVGFHFICQLTWIRDTFLDSKAKLHKSSEWSSLISGPDWILLLRKPRIPASLCDSATTCHLEGWSRILQDKTGANKSSLTPLNCILKNWDRSDPQGLKKTHLIFLCDTACHGIHWRMANSGWLEGLLSIMLLLSRFSRVRLCATSETADRKSVV